MKASTSWNIVKYFFPLSTIIIIFIILSREKILCTSKLEIFWKHVSIVLWYSKNGDSTFFVTLGDFWISHKL